MPVQRAFTAEPGFTADFFRVRDFLRRLNADAVTTPGFLWARWEWAFSLPFQDRTALGRIGVWEADGTIVALATYELALGEAYLVCDPEHRDLLPEMVRHGIDHLCAADGTVRFVVPDGDRELAVDRAEAVGQALEHAFHAFVGALERFLGLDQLQACALARRQHAVGVVLGYHAQGLAVVAFFVHAGPL